MKASLSFTSYPNLKIGFSTQNFQKIMKVNVANLSELVDYALYEGYHFIMIRDDLAELSDSECIVLAEYARKCNIEIIYEIHINPLDEGYMNVFEKGLRNTSLFGAPGIIRTIVSKSEFDNDPLKKGWTDSEFIQLTKVCDDCTAEANKMNIKFVVENFNEAFFGDANSFFGLADLITNTQGTGLQFDISNPFRNTSREKAEPERVEQYLKTNAKRWITTHLKTIINGEIQSVLTDNPIPIERIVNLMGIHNIKWVAIELPGEEDKNQCYNNHAMSIKYLNDIGILK